MANHEKIQEAVRLYRSGQSVYEIAPQLGVAFQTIHKWLKKANEPRRTKSEAGKLAVQRKGKWQERYTYNHAAFREITEPEQAYWIGFLAADGTINDSGVVQISLGVKDISQLQKLRLFLKTDAEIRLGHLSDELGERDYCRLNICSQEIWADLNRHGIQPRKTKTVAWPRWLSDDLKWPYLLGYFDGDGGFCVGKEGGSEIQWSIAGHPDFLLDAQAFLISTLGFSKVKLIARGNTEVIKSLSYGGTVQVANVSLQMYRSCPIRMERKLERFAGYLKANHRLIKIHFKVLEELEALLLQC